MKQVTKRKDHHPVVLSMSAAPESAVPTHLHKEHTSSKDAPVPSMLTTKTHAHWSAEIYTALEDILLPLSAVSPFVCPSPPERHY